MTRIFLIHPEALYRDVVPLLSGYGIEVVLACASESSDSLVELGKLLPNAEMISSFEAMGAELPPGSRARPEPPSLSTIEALSAWEGAALQMIDRLNYDGRSVHEMRSFFLRYAAYWQGLMKSHRPDAVVFHGTPHMGHDFVLYLLCKEEGIRTLIVERTYLDERLFFRESIEDSVCPSAEEIAAMAADMPSPASEPLPSAAHYETLNRALNDLADIKRRLSLPRLVWELIDPRNLRTARRRVTSSIHGLSQKRPTAWALRWWEAQDHLRARRCLRYYEQHVGRPNLSADFIYYPLHFEPERTTVPDGGRIADQLHVIDILLPALPVGWMLYVKEHPRQFRRGVLWNKARSLDFYRRLAARPRVALVPLDMPSGELVARSRAVATITGTAGWEAVQAGKPALVFGHPWYQHCPGVQRVASADSCARILADVAAGGLAADSALAHAFAELIANKYTFRACFSESVLRLSQLTSRENGASYATAIGRALAGQPLAPVSGSAASPLRPQESTR